jgi:PAS domain S-box-containing protein
MTHRIMLVEDEAIVAMDVRQRLQVMGYEVVAHATSGEDAIRFALDTAPDLILMDIKIRGDLDGTEAAAQIRKSQNIPVIYLAAYTDESTLVKACLSEAFGYLIKPFEDRELHSSIEIALYKHKMEKKLQESEERYRKLVETSPDGIAITDLKGCLLAVNPKNAEMWGYETPEEMVGLSLLDLVASENRSKVEENLNRVIEGNKTTPFAHPLLRQDKALFWGELNACSLQDSNGQIASLIVITRDITERKQAEQTILRLNSELEQRVASRTADLAVSNKELESFAYSVSHDLRAPLRTLNGFSHLLLEEHAHTLSPQGQELLNRIQKSSVTMSKLIDALLDLSRITRTEMTRKEVDLSQVTRDISLDLCDNEPARVVEFIIPDSMPVKGDPNLIGIMLNNLICNAWKFSSKVSPSRIELGSSIQNGQMIYFISDNGVGFDKAYENKLFGAFHRLHTAFEFEGTGIGLSIVQRIIHRHGGQVWAQGEIGKGATFYFTLP